MTAESTQTDPEQPPLPGRWASSPVVAKWGEAAYAGFQMLPDVLVKHQNTLGLTATEFVVLVNLTMHWWYPTQRPFPRSTTIAQRMGIDVRTVQRALNRLVELELISRVRVEIDGVESTVIDLAGLVRRLSEMAVDDVTYRRRQDARADMTPERPG